MQGVVGERGAGLLQRSRDPVGAPSKGALLVKEGPVAARTTSLWSRQLLCVPRAIPPLRRRNPVSLRPRQNPGPPLLLHPAPPVCEKMWEETMATPGRGPGHQLDLGDGARGHSLRRPRGRRIGSPRQARRLPSAFLRFILGTGLPILAGCPCVATTGYQPATRLSHFAAAGQPDCSSLLFFLCFTHFPGAFMRTGVVCPLEGLVGPLAT